MALRSARELALVALRQWRTRGGFADAILGRLLRSNDLIARDRTFATELFYGILRNLSLLDFWIGSLRSGRLDHDGRDLLRLGIYQLFFLKTPEHAAVNETVELASARTRALVNAVLRNALRKKDQLLAKASQQDLSVRCSHPQFLIDRWTQNFGAKNAETLCEWNNHPAQIYARINRLNTSVEEFCSKHSDAERLAQPDNFVRLASVPNDALASGQCYIQDPSTAAACLLLDPRPGEKVLDACAAPGGKTGYIAELMKNQGALVACDRDEGRIRTLQENLKRLGIEIARFVQRDWTGGEPVPKATAISSFDRILVDAPCSNTGVMRRRVDLRWRLSQNDFRQLHSVQLDILRATIPLLKTGGILVYSTCSIEPEENERVVTAITDEFSGLSFVEQVLLSPFREGYDGGFAAKTETNSVARLHLASPVESLTPMHDPRFDRLAKVLVEYSTRLKRNETVLIETFDIPDEMTVALVRAARKAGAIPFAQLQHARVNRELALNATERQLNLTAIHELTRMKKMDAYIAIRGSNNITELSDVPPEQMKLVAKKMRPVNDQRVQKTKWVVLRWPSPSMAQLAGMSSEAFENFYFDVCTLDYRKLQPGMKALKKLMDKTDRVEIKGPGVDLRFSIKGIGAVICGGDRNIPDGEVFSCPVKESVQGYVLFNAPTIYQGIGFDNIRLEFCDGKVVKATGNQTEKLNKILDSDPGARYIGEFSLGFNPLVLHPIRDILFDEKIAGSFHFTPGQAYEEADNGNRSQVHWDMVNIQRRDYGGGEIYFDGKLIRRDGEFLPAQLRSLNRSRFAKN